MSIRMKCDHSSESCENYFPVLHKVVLIFESVNEILKCDHSNESYQGKPSSVVLFVMLYKLVLIDY